MSKNVKATIWTTIAIMAVIIGIVTYERQQPQHVVVQKTSPIAKAETSLSDQAPTVKTPETATSSPVVVASSTPASRTIYKPKVKSTIPSYGDMVAKYSFNRIQFAPGCLQATPNQIAIANPVTLMLDNRSDQAQTITIGTHNYMVAPYNYVIATINEPALPVTLFVSCNQQKNVAQIILQK